MGEGWGGGSERKLHTIVHRLPPPLPPPFRGGRLQQPFTPVTEVAMDSGAITPIEKPRARPRREAVVEVKKINLALQGGGAHGAFAWGVLDRLLEDDRVEIEGISATSAGAMNATVLTYGYATGG